MKQTHDTLLGYVFWIFGFMGLHRFYTGRKKTGALWALTGGLLGIGWLIDVFFVPSMVREANARYTQAKHDTTISWLLLVFLGIFGIHRFYLGKWGTGLIWLFTGGLLGIGWIYDLFTMNEQLAEN
jgi:TM2 domain-containing membrane protein YozV